jgi:hypothetical protein
MAFVTEMCAKMLKQLQHTMEINLEGESYILNTRHESLRLTANTVFRMINVAA